MRRVIVVMTVLGVIIWSLNLISGLRTAASLKSVGVDDFSMTAVPFVMPIVGLFLSTLGAFWLVKIKRMSLAVTLSGFSLSAAALVAFVAGSGAAG